MSFSDYKKIHLKYQNASLPVKISVPFILMFLGFWIVGTASLGYFLAHKLEQGEHKRSVKLAALVKEEIYQELNTLQKEAYLLSIKEPIIKGVINQDRLQLQQIFSPLKSILNAHAIAIINQDHQLLLNTQSVANSGINSQIAEAKGLLIKDLESTALISSKNSEPPILIGTASINNEQGKIGRILIGTPLGDEFLAQINQSIQEQIILISNEAVVASTFPPDTDAIERLEIPKNHSSITINNQKFFAHLIPLRGWEDKRFGLVLLTSQQSLTQAKQTTWMMIMTMASVGAILTIILGYWIAKKVARPIQDITLIAQQVVGESRFDLRAPANTQDDISILALSVNQLIEWVGQYTNELEIAAQTLDIRVQKRTHKLSKTLNELKATQTQLIQSEKMSSLGQMIAGIAHEINNPISFVKCNIDPLKEYFQDLLDLIKTYEAEYPEPSAAVLKKQEEIDFDFLLTDLDKLLGSMDVGAERVHEIVKSLRNFSRLDEATVKDVDIHEGLDSTLLILNHRLKHEVTVVKKYGELPLVRCFPAQLNQVFTNIIVNALDAMAEANCAHKKIKIITRMSRKDQVQIIISDRGPGIPRNIRKKIFDPFFTTKSVGTGTGLGLGICFRIIQQHQGNIRIRSKIGKGTEVVITLPIDVLSADPVVAIPGKVTTLTPKLNPVVSSTVKRLS
ncbi:MAG: ATP-binding protein [Leptolyngbyaceae cyanobacterium]|mgnify:CR=1 FL=1